jgi:outer membrane biogenesis lipoprotein LolB
LNYRPDGRLAKLQQGQWLVTYPEYVTIEGVMMPRKVFLENHELSVRLVIDRWVLNRALEGA